MREKVSDSVVPGGNVHDSQSDMRGVQQTAEGTGKMGTRRRPRTATVDDVLSRLTVRNKTSWVF